MYLKHPDLGNPANFHHSSVKFRSWLYHVQHYISSLQWNTKSRTQKLTLSRELGRTSFQGEAEMWPCFFKLLPYWINLSVSSFITLSFFPSTSSTFDQDNGSTKKLFLGNPRFCFPGSYGQLLCNLLSCMEPCSSSLPATPPTQSTANAQGLIYTLKGSFISGVFFFVS